jgi:hypothetical protein
LTPSEIQASYTEYNDLCGEDKPVNEDVLKNLLTKNPQAQLVFVTARPVYYLDVTKNWLRQNFNLWPANYTLLMRPTDNIEHSPELKKQLLLDNDIDPTDVIAAFDDRLDVVKAYWKLGIDNAAILGLPESDPATPDEILAQMAATFKERNQIYGDNWRVVGKVMEVLHGEGSAAPAGDLVGTAEQFDVWHLWELLIVKLSRFANSGLTHADSIHDLAVYAAMIESIIKERA